RRPGRACAQRAAAGHRHARAAACVTSRGGDGVPLPPARHARIGAVRAAGRTRLPARHASRTRRRHRRPDARLRRPALPRRRRRALRSRLQDQPPRRLRPGRVRAGHRRQRLRPAVPDLPGRRAALAAPASWRNLRPRPPPRRRRLPVPARPRPGRRHPRHPSRPPAAGAHRRHGCAVRRRRAMTAAEALAQLARGKPSPPLREVDRAFARLLQRMGGTAEVALAGALAMRAVSLGHGGFPLAGACALLDELDADVALPDTDAWADALRASPLVAESTDASAPLVFEHGMVALRRYARYEQRLADALRNRRGAVAEAVDDDALARLFALQPGTLDRQALAAWTVLRQRLTLVTGGPGTGKTTTVARMLALLAARAPADEAQSVRIALAAPTGRAAARLGEAVADALARDVEAGRLDADVAARVPRQAQTLHRLLGWQRSGAFRHDAALPLPFDVVVVDEASMVDLPMMARLVDAVAPDARLVLLGDPDQLPAVEAGDVLGALCAAAGDGLAVPAEFEALAASGEAPGDPSESHPRESGDPATSPATAPLAGHRIHLTRGHRQANAARVAKLA